MSRSIRLLFLCGLCGLGLCGSCTRHYGYPTSRVAATSVAAGSLPGSAARTVLQQDDETQDELPPDDTNGDLDPGEPAANDGDEPAVPPEDRSDDGNEQTPDEERERERERGGAREEDAAPPPLDVLDAGPPPDSMPSIDAGVPSQPLPID